MIQDAIDTQLGPAYGLIVVDGSDAAFGKVQGLNASLASGPVVKELGCLNAHIAARTRRGGQSALRYSRNRDASELAFLRKVSERAATLLTDVHGVILGGKADMKQKLIQELPESLRKHVVCTVDLSCNAGPEALRHAALRAAGSVASSEHSEAERELCHFFELVLKDSMCCYGEGPTIKALELGAVEHLLLSANVDTRLDVDAWTTLAASYGTRVVEISPISEQGDKFCQAFRVGACLRWPLELELLEEDAVAEEEDAVAEEVGCMTSCAQDIAALACDEDEPAMACAEVERASVSTTDTLDMVDVSRHHEETLQWFQSELSNALGDPSTAEAIAACVHVVLSDEVSSRDEVTEGVLAVASAEGVPEELTLELIRRW